MEGKRREISVRKSDTRTGTFKLGFFMVVAAFLLMMDIIRHVDDNTVPPRNRKDHKRLSHGVVAFVLCLYLFDTAVNNHPIYRVEEWVKRQPFLRLLFPFISPGYFTEDRIARTLDAIGNNVGNISIEQSSHLVETFKIALSVVYIDLTNFSVSGDYEYQDPGSVIMGYSPCPKSGKRNQKTVSKISLTSEDGGIPFYSETLKGSDPDTICYCPAIEVFRKITGSESLRDTVFVGDSKSMSSKTQTLIDNGGGHFVGMKYKTDDNAICSLLNQLGQLSELLETVDAVIEEESVEVDIEFLNCNIDNPGLRQLMQTSHGKKRTLYSGCDLESSYTGTDNEEHYLREVLISSSEKQKSELLKLERNLEQSEESLRKVQKGALGSRYNSKGAVLTAAEKVLSKNSCLPLYTLDVREIRTIVKKATSRGRHTERTQFIETEKVYYELTYEQNPMAIKQKRDLCGFFILQTNLTREQADNKRILQLYKGHDKVEKTFATDKSVLHVTPLWLKSTRRIKGLLYLYAVLSQVVTLIDREIVINMRKQGIKSLSGIIPDKNIEHPHTPYIRSLFEEVRCYLEESPDGNISIEVHGMTGQLKQLVNLAGVDTSFFSDESIASNLSDWMRDYPQDFENTMLLTLHEPNRIR